MSAESRRGECFIISCRRHIHQLNIGYVDHKIFVEFRQVIVDDTQRYCSDTHSILDKY